MDTEFDYVIVGAGSAGCVLANRLSADPSVSVCLLEAGPRDRSPLIHIPLGMAVLMQHAKLNWRYLTTPQAHEAGRQVYIPRGRTLGGSSSINGMVYMRGHRLDYDDWARAGNEGWSYAEVLPYFRRSENNESFPDSPYHGTGGPLNVTHLDRYSPLAEAMMEAAESLQMPRAVDFNGATQEGFGLRQATIRNGRRESTATAYLDPARHRRNLTIVTGALADRITIVGRRATGVEVLVDGAPRHIVARREVLLAGGAIASPAVLLRSGIGDPAELARHGIGVVHELPGVGRNLQDHPATPIMFDSPTTVPYGISWRSVPWLAWQLVEYALFRKGLLANNIAHAGGFVRTRPDLDRPDIQFILLPVDRKPGSALSFGHGYGLMHILLRPKSRGTITLDDARPDSAPRIDPHFFEDEDDLELVVRGMKLGRRILEAPAFAPYRGTELKPGPEVRTDDQLRDFIRAETNTVFHPVGTCKMGRGPDAVVDARLRVHGLDGLRVIDASIMPDLIGGNTNAPTIMIAEKGADLVLGKPPPAPLPAL